MSLNTIPVNINMKEWKQGAPTPTLPQYFIKTLKNTFWIHIHFVLVPVHYEHLFINIYCNQSHVLTAMVFMVTP